jgi:N-acetylglutamate synthase-like GNAT family acetyltransferase
VPEVIEIAPFAARHADGVVAVILPIQQREFEIPITLDEQPDLRDIPGFYQRGKGAFWVALDGERVVGTVALLDIGDDQAALRKMFVSAAYRGGEHGVAKRLLETLLAWCRSRGVREVYLGTTAKFLAAHQFYEKSGFREVSRAELPASFPVMAVDTKFYARSIPVEMSAESVSEILETLDRASVGIWLDGGWGVDALLGEQTRSHLDLDVIVSISDAAKIRAALGASGFVTKPGGTPTNFVLADPLGREVDVHAIEFDERGNGAFQLPDGRKWPFPPSAFRGRGRVTGREVQCLSADAQVQCHGQGYVPAEKDLRDMERLQARFGVVLPLHLCRQRG